MALLLLVVLILGISTWSESVESIIAEGMAAVQNGHEDIARDQALADALRRAVEQTVGTLIASETMVKNYEVLNDEIYSHTRGYVRQYDVLKERHDGNLFRVTIRAAVDTGQLKQDLQAMGLLYQRVKQPRFMVVIPETHIGRQPPDPAGETEIIRQLITRGIKVVDQAQSRRIRRSDQMRTLLSGDVETAKRIGLRHGAEVMIVGEAFSEGAMRRATLISVRARVEARAIRTDTGEILTADGQFAPGVDIAEHIAGKKALAKAGERWLEANLPVILKRWETETANTSSVQIVVHGLTLKQLIQFEQVLKSQVRGVKNIQRRSFDHKVAVLEVDVQGTGQSLANDLTVRDLGYFVAEVTAFTPHRVDVEVRPKSGVK
jgi:hypothetical protein